MTDQHPNPGALVRSLLRRAERASLSSALARDGSAWPYGSLVLLTVDQDASPLLLLSDLSDHSQNIKADPRVSLLIEDTKRWRDPLAGPRATVLGRAVCIADPEQRAGVKARIVRRHPGAALYADFKDFRLFRLEIERAHLVAGFGKIHWLEGAEVRLTDPEIGTFAPTETAGCRSINDGDETVLQALIAAQLDAQPGPWTLVGLDPEGCDLRGPDGLVRLDFEQAVSHSKDLMAAFRALTTAKQG